MGAAKTRKLEVCGAAATWDEAGEDSGGNPVAIPKVAYHGEIIEVPEPRASDLVEQGVCQEPGSALLVSDPRRPHPASQEAINELAGVNPHQVVDVPEGGGVEADADVDDQPFDVTTADASEIAERIKSKKLNVGDTVALANDDQNLAVKVIEAEQLLDDPRTGVITKLEKIEN